MLINEHGLSETSMSKIANLEKGKSQNVFKQVDTNLLHMFMFTPAMEYAKAYFGGQTELKQESLNDLIQMSWDALKA